MSTLVPDVVGISGASNITIKLGKQLRARQINMSEGVLMHLNLQFRRIHRLSSCCRGWLSVDFLTSRWLNITPTSGTEAVFLDSENVRLSLVKCESQ